MGTEPGFGEEMGTWGRNGDGAEWHLLNVSRVTMFSDVVTGERPRFG